MERYSIQEVIEQAIRTEQLGYEFYTKMSERFKEDEALQNLFTTLAQKERQHEKTFSALKEKTKKQAFENWEEVSNYLRAIVESEFFLGQKKSLPSLEHITSISEALKLSISFERETLLYFYELKNIVEEKGVLDEIIKEEKSHIIELSEYKKKLPQ